MSVRCSRARNSDDGKSNSIGCFCCSLQALDAFAAHLAEARIAEPPLAFSRQRFLGANRDHRPLLLGERGIDVLEEHDFAALASRSCRFVQFIPSNARAEGIAG